MHPERLPYGVKLLEEFPSLKRSFNHPAKNIGLGETARFLFI